jgi:6,7-dimethyl-8-ribityllumazine synthase
MLKPTTKSSARAAGATFAIVASKYNGRYVDAMLKAAQRELKKAGAKVQVVRVPGAFEIPAVAAALAAAGNDDGSRITPHASHPASRPAAILCLGVIFQGQTSHAQHIGWGVTHALAAIQVQHRIPVIHGVFVFENQEHARVRCLGRTHNRGAEAAHTALEMAAVMKKISN